jgi:hypothetical protein
MRQPLLKMPSGSSLGLDPPLAGNGNERNAVGTQGPVVNKQLRDRPPSGHGTMKM